MTGPGAERLLRLLAAVLTGVDILAGVPLRRPVSGGTDAAEPATEVRRLDARVPERGEGSIESAGGAGPLKVKDGRRFKRRVSEAGYITGAGVATFDKDPGAARGTVMVTVSDAGSG